MKAILVRDNGYLRAAAIRQIGYISLISNIALKLERLARL
jgi:hypothetical protein